MAAAVFYLSGRFEDAVRAGDRALALHPEFALALYLTGFALCQLGQFDRAIERHERLVALSHRNPIYIGLLGHALGLAGRHSAALALVEELTARRGSEYVVPTAWLLLWAGLGDRDRAYDTLVDCVREGVNGMAILLFLYPHLKSLAEEPRFAEMFSRVNLKV